jgi:hypothetical protein
VFLDANRQCRVTDTRADQPPEITCTIETLAATLNPIVNRLPVSGPIELNVGFHVIIGAAPDYPLKDLQEVITACQATGVHVPRIR